MKIVSVGRERATPCAAVATRQSRPLRALWCVLAALGLAFMASEATAQACVEDGGSQECVAREQLDERFHPGGFSACPVVPAPPSSPPPYIGQFANENDALEYTRSSLICGNAQAFCQLPTSDLQPWGGGLAEPGFLPKWECRTHPSLGVGRGVVWSVQMSWGGGCYPPSTGGTTMCVDRPMICPPGFTEGYLQTIPNVLGCLRSLACNGGCPVSVGRGGGGLGGGGGGDGGPISVGNPITLPLREKHQLEIDASLAADFQLQLSRIYKSGGFRVPIYTPAGQRMTQLDGSWRFSFDHRLSVITSSVTGKTVARLVRGDFTTRYFILETTGFVGHSDEPGTFAAIVDGGGATVGYRYRTSNDRDEEYLLSGRLARITTQGLVTTFVYDVAGRLHQIQSPTGRILEFHYDGSSERVASVTLPDGEAVAYAYGEAGDISSVALPSSVNRSYHYSSNTAPLKLSAIIDENGANYAQFSYASSGMVDEALSTQHSGSVERYVVTRPSATSLRVELPLGEVSTYDYQVIAGARRLTQITQTCTTCPTRTSTRTYDSNGFLNVVADFRGVTTDHDYATRALETQRIEAANASGTPSAKRTIQTDWHASFRKPIERRVRDSANALESKSQWVYNARGQLTARCELDPADSVAMAYTCSETTAPSSSAKVRRWTYAYCEAGDVAASGSTCPILGLTKLINGPRDSGDAGMSSLDDVTTFTYYATTDESGCGTVAGPCRRKGDLWKTTNALGHVSEVLSYDKSGRVVLTKDPNGVLTGLSYNARGWLTARRVYANATPTTSAGDAITLFAYDGTGQITLVTQPDGVALGYIYDDAHRLTDIVDSLGNRIHYTLDNAGNRIKEETFDANYDPLTPGQGLKRSLARQYNALNRLVRDLNASAAATRDSTPYDTSPLADGFDANGNSVQWKDGLNVQAQQTYDPLNRLVKAIQDYTGTHAETGDATTEYGYDARDNLRTVTDPDNLTTTYTYDGLGNQTGLDSPDTGHTDYAYDRAGNRISQTDNRGVTSSYVYDALGRLLGITYPTSALDVAFAYDQGNTTTGCAASTPLGRLTRMTDATGSTTYCYDKRGNVTSKTQVTAGTTLTVAYTHTLADRVATITYPSGGIATYGYDSAGRPLTLSWKKSSIASPVTIVSDISYYPFGPPHMLTYGNGRTLTKTYDQDYAIDSVESSAFGGLVLDFGRDVMGNITSASSALGTTPPDRQYVYDKLYRLTRVNDATGAMLEDYNYNKTGDRTLKQFAGQAAQVYTYLSGTHRLGSVDGTSRSYDDNGNTTDRGDGVTLAYSDQNRLYGADVPGNWTEYAYSGRGERVHKLQDNSGTPVLDRYVYNETGQMLHNLKQETTGGLPVETPVEYLFVDAIPVAQIRGKVLSYIEADHLGTPRVSATPATNDQEWDWDLLGDVFGANEAVTAIGGETVDLRYPGQWMDSETGLHYNYFRDYEPATGRYAESDPIGLSGGVGTYAYVGGNPLILSDYFGLIADSVTNACIRQPELCVLAGGAAVGAAATLPKPDSSINTDTDSATCPDNQPCDPPAGTRCVSMDAGHNHKGRGDPHWHTYQMNRIPNGPCTWNKMRAFEHTYGSDAPPPKGLAPCETYPSWFLQHG
jgi:RHS repeat-associated protein